MKHQKYFSKQDVVKLRALIQEKTGHCIRSSYILSQAFRRRSYCAEDGGKSNELFELIGDQVLGHYVVKRIAERSVSLNIEGDYSCRIREDQFTSLKQELTSNQLFAELIDEWNIADYLIVGKSDVHNRADQQTKVKADLFEAIIGAITVDSKWDPIILEKAVCQALNLDERLQRIVQNECNLMGIHIDNAIMKLKELAEKEQCSMPKYEFFDLGKDKDGNPIWGCIGSIINDRTGIRRTVSASSKKEAQKATAYLLLCEHLQLQNQYGDNDWFPIWIYQNGKLYPDRPKQGTVE